VCHNDVTVGAVCCRLEPNGAGAQKLYVMVLGVLAPYREYGIGASLQRSASNISDTFPSCVLQFFRQMFDHFILSRRAPAMSKSKFQARA
jgi:hypothetical protein